MTAPPRFLGSVYDAHSDNDIDNEVFLQAAGLSYSDRQCLDLGVERFCLRSHQPCNPRHPTDRTSRELQLLRPSRPQHRRHTHTHRTYKSPWGCSLEHEGTTAFVRSSVVNGCRVWTRDLFARMAEIGLMSQEVFDDADRGVPLVKRRLEILNSDSSALS